ncbi:unnamed protein product [Gongylonema pulchrum]|uniref:Protein-ribulosamine 3-kinase n=1 Tax=Gongylonema pulchrum TaxID=637853 RepID=A0A183E3I4_9BILA|nr:unnamed protein product [Gongylonema pulchrum]
MEAAIKRELGLKKLEPFGGAAGGCISRGGGYHTDQLGDLFIKFNDRENVTLFFYSISDGGRHCLVTEYIDMHGPSKPSQLGRDLARYSISFLCVFFLHLCNAENSY